MGEAVSSGWIEILKFVGPAAAVAIIYLYIIMRFVNRILDRVDKREKTLLEFVDKHSTTSAIRTEVNRSLCERVTECADKIEALGEKILLLIQKVGE